MVSDMTKNLSWTGAVTAQSMRPVFPLLSTGVRAYLLATTLSLFFGLIDSNTGRLRYVNAGHEPPMLARAGGAEEVLDPTGPILGVDLDAMYSEKVVALKSRDVVLLMSDGVTEARNKAGDFMGSDGVWRILRWALGAPVAQKTAASIASALRTYAGSRPTDDLALLFPRRA